MNDTFIPKANRQAFLNRITVNTNMNTIKSNVKNVDNGIRTQKEKEAKNRDEFSTFLNGLELTNKEKMDLLKNYNAGKTNKNVIRNKALSINAAVKAKAAQRQELSNYINSLGINGKAILNKFNGGRSTLDKLKKEADKAKSLANAQIVKNKRDNIRAFMKETRLPNSNKNSFINRIEVNTNMNTIKREIKELNSVLKSRNDELARKKTELSTYLNGLNDLTSNQRSALLKKVVNANTNIQPLKNEGTRLNKNVKNKRAEQKRLEEEKRIKEEEAKKALKQKKFENHLRSLKHLTSKEMEGYAKNLANGKATLEDLIAVSKAKNADNEKDKDAVRNYVRKASIPQTKKNVYLKQLNTPYVNITPIKGLVNANVETQKKELQKLIREAEAKLKKITDLSANERDRFKIRLQSESVSNVLEEARKLSANRKEARKVRDQQTKDVATKLQGLSSLERNNRKKLMNRLATNGAQKVVANAQALNKERKNAMAKKKAEEEAKKKAEEEAKKKVEEARKVRDQQTKDVATKLRGLSSLERNNRKKFMNRLTTNGPQKVLANAQALNKERKNAVAKKKAEEEAKKKAEEEAKKKVEEARKVRDQQTKDVATKLRGLSSLERNNRKKFMNRLTTNGPQKVLANAQALNKERKNAVAKKKAEEEAKKKAEEEAKKKVEEARKVRDQQTKDVATKLRGLSSLERNNRKKFMNRLTTNGPQKVLANAQALNKERKDKREAEKRMIEDRRKAEEAKKKAEGAKKKLRNLQTKKLATRLQGLTSLKRENRKKFMNRLEQNGFSRVLGNAQALNKERKEDAARIRGGVETKLTTIGVKGANLQALMKRWNNSKNKTIFNDARKKVEGEKARIQPLLDKVVREIPGTFGQWRRGWEDAVRKATTPQELQRLDRLLDEKSKLRKEIEKAPIAEDKRRGQLRFVMQLRNDLGKRRVELARDIKTKKDMGDA